MSVQVPEASQEPSSLKRSKSQKRKHRDISSSIAPVADSLQSPTKRARKATSPVAQQAQSVAHAIRPRAQPESPFRLRTASLYLAVSPITLLKPLEGLCAEHLSPLLLTYYPPLRGVVLSYSNPRISESIDENAPRASQNGPILALSVAEYGVSYTWFTADFLVLAPPAGTKIEGYISVQSETHIGLVCWNLFNATVSSERLPKDWKWNSGASGTEVGRAKRRERLKGESGDNGENRSRDVAQNADAQEQGYWIDGEGQKAAGKILFDVVMMDAEGGSQQEGNYVSIVGTMLNPEDEAVLTEQKRDILQKRRSWKEKPQKHSAPVMLGAVQDRN